MAKLYFYYSAMNAGKTTTLLQSSFNYQERGMNTMLFTARIDDRYGNPIISSRIGITADANLFEEGTDLFSIVAESIKNRPLHCILVDEAQFLSKDQVFQLAAIADSLKIPVLCYGLRTDFQANLFEGSKWLLALADEMNELKTICTCGRKASMNLRIDENGNAVKDGASIEIGGNDRYIALCRKHFMEKLRGPASSPASAGEAIVSTSFEKVSSGQ
jgi:thymidine kinase